MNSSVLLDGADSLRRQDWPENWDKCPSADRTRFDTTQWGWSEASPPARSRPSHDHHLSAYHGTSPRARGRQLAVNGDLVIEGTISTACAGPTSRFLSERGCRWEHPRVRGADPEGGGPDCSGRGTSPRARGRPRLLGSAVTCSRNIPACAGPTMGRRRPRASQWEHPRVRGPTSIMPKSPAVLREHPRVRGADREHAVTLAVGGGTSPRARGRHA